jgi:type IV pilus assembly protein PilA
MTTSRWLVFASVLALSACGSITERFSKQAASANEIGAVANMKSISTAEVSYNLDHGQFAPSLDELRSSLPADLISGEKSGYRFKLKGSKTSFSVEAAPTTFGSTGNRTFYTDETMVIREHEGPEPATADSPDIEKRLGGK